VRSERVTALRRWRRRGGLALLVISPLGASALWLTFQHKPSWYRPVLLSADNFQRARREAVAAADDFGDKLVAGRPFEVTLRQQSVNEWLAALPEIWPEAKDALPPELSAPAVRFEPGLLRIGAHLERAVGQTILSVDLVPEVSKDGASIGIAARALRAGSLSIPRILFERVLPWFDPQAPSTAPDDRVSIGQLFSGVTSSNRFVWPNGERAFRIQSVSLIDGELHLNIEPL